MKSYDQIKIAKAFCEGYYLFSIDHESEMRGFCRLQINSGFSSELMKNKI